MRDTEKKLLQAAKNGNFAECDRLIQQGVNVNAKDDDHEIGWSPLLLAARSGHLDLVRLLLQQGAAVNAKSKSEQTPLHGASWNGHAHVAKLLMDHGADPNARNKFGQTPLHWAAHYGHAAVCQVLVAHGALVNARNEDGETPLDKAQSSAVKSAGRAAVIQLLQRSQTKLNFLAILFAKKDEFNFHEWHERMIAVMEDMHDMRVYYTVLRMSLARRMILKRQAEALLERALERSSALCHSEAAFGLWRTLLAKCLHDELIDEHVYNTFDGYDRSPTRGGGSSSGMRGGSSSMMMMMMRDMPTPSLRSCIHKRSAQINGLEGSSRAVQRTIQVLIRKMQALRQDEMAQTTTGKQQQHANPSVKSKRFKVKLDALVSMLGSIVNAIALSTCTPAHERIFARMVDFGDVQHMRHALNSSPDAEPYVQSFEAGVELALQVHDTPAMTGPLAKQLDDAIKRKEPLLIMGFVAGLANPPPASRVESSPTSQATLSTQEQVTVVSGRPGMLPQEQRFSQQHGDASLTKKPSMVTASMTTSSYLTSKGGPVSSSSFSNPTPVNTKPREDLYGTGSGKIVKEDHDPYDTMPPGGKIVKEDPYTPSKPSTTTTKQVESASIPSIVPKHLPPIKQFEMPVTTDSKSLSSSHLGASSSKEVSLEEDVMASEFIMTSSQKYTLTRIYKDAILIEDDECKYDLHAAVKYGDKELIQEALSLIGNDGDDDDKEDAINAKDSNGRTALDLAALTGQLELMALLREHGGKFAFKSGARMRAVARRRSEFVATYLQLVENELD